MRITGLSGTVPADLVAVGVPVHSGEDGPRHAVEPLPTGTPAVALDPERCVRRGFKGSIGETLVLPAADGPDVVLVGLGKIETFAGDAGAEALRRASASFVRAAGRGGPAALLVPRIEGLTTEEVAEAAAVGAALAGYHFDRFRNEPQPGSVDEVALLGADAGGDPAAEALRAGATRGARLAESVAFARDLINEPPSSLTPARFAERVTDRLDGRADLSIEIWDDARIEAERLGGLLGVARGSAMPPRLFRVEYQPPDPLVVAGRTPLLALVGKGITFDSGGLSLKTAGGMETMKTDMSGAAAVLAAIDAAAALGSRIGILGITPLTENMPGASAIKPGDVLTARNGKTIEVLNTDAEGRLVLADGLSLAAEAGPDAIVDVATLTGAAVVALGKDVAGLLGNDSELLDEVRVAGERAGEALWPLPMPDDYRAHIESDIADMRNIGRTGQAGTIAAAMLLREFVGEVPWAHLDIAGPARSDESRGYLAKGGTGFAVRTLVGLATSQEFATALANLRST